MNKLLHYLSVGSPNYRIYFTDKGSGEIPDQFGNLSLEPGYLYLIPSFTHCNLDCTDDLSQYLAQFFEESANSVSLFAHNRIILKIKATTTDIKLFNRLLNINPSLYWRAAR